MALLPRLRLALGIRRPARPCERRLVRLRGLRQLCGPAELRPPHEYPLDPLFGRRGGVRGARLHALLPLLREGALPAGRALPLHTPRAGPSPPRHRLRSGSELRPGRGEPPRHARVCRNVQLVRPERPPVPLLLPPARRDRRTARNHAREGRIPAALLQREGHPDRHRTREDRILPHAGLLAQLDEPHEEVPATTSRSCTASAANGR